MDKDEHMIVLSHLMCKRPLHLFFMRKIIIFRPMKVTNIPTKIKSDKSGAQAF